MSSSYTAILPGSRVRNDEGFIGTVEGLHHVGRDAGVPPDSMVVRADDGRWRYTIPLFLVGDVRQEPLHTIVHVRIAAGDLVHYVSEQLQERKPGLEGAGEPATAVTTDGGALRVPVLEEEIVAHKVPILLGNVHIHKGVQTDEREVTVPLHREKTVIEHIPPEQFDASAPTSPNEVIIPVVEEELVVQKRTVVKEYLRVRKEIITEEKLVRGKVRREVVEVSGQPKDEKGAGGEPLLGKEPEQAERPPATPDRRSRESGARRR